MSKIIKMVLLGMLCMAFFTGSAWANDAKDYMIAPAGTKVALFYFNHGSGNEMYSNGNLVTHNANLETDVGIFRGVYWGELAGMTYNVNVLLPVGHLRLGGAAIGNEVSASQMGDPLLVAVLWPYKNPNTKTYFGVGGYITVPLGEYRNDNVLNMGANRWAFKGELGLEQGLGNSGFNIGIYGNGEFYTDNNNYTSAGATMSQDPILTAEAHLTYDFTKTFYAGVDYYYKWGGETSVDFDYGGYDNDDRLSTHSAGLTLGYTVSDHIGLQLKYTKDISVDNGIKTDTVGFRLAYFW